jgi:hypothetical protein
VAVASSAPTREIGAEAQASGTTQGWSAFVDEAEYVPELMWPASVQTYHRQRNDSQVEALHSGTTQPVREFRWSIDTNGAPAALCERASEDLGLPLRGHEDDHIPRARLQGVNFDEFLTDVLLAPVYGHFYFEIVGRTNPARTEWHVERLAPRHPRTIADFQTTPAGQLLAIRQNIAGAGGWLRQPEPIPASALVPFVWRREAGSWVGRSLLRSIYREWLVKDRTIRVAAINLERAGGMPVVEGPQGASDAQLGELAKLARQFKVAEGGGGAIPFGSKLHLVGGNTPDAINLLEYCDQAMARVWALMLIQLGTTATGSRALGGEFATFAARAHRAMAGWVVSQANSLLERYTEWNLGPGATHAPRLYFEQSKPDALSVADLVAMIEAGALTVDPELEGWIRGEWGLPESQTIAVDGLGDLTPDEIALVQQSRQPPALPAPAPAPPGGPPPVPAATAARRGRMSREVYAATMLPSGRELRRAPYDHEIRAAVDFGGLDVAHEQAFAQVEGLFRGQVIPAQITALGEQVVTTQAGTARQVVTRSAMASLNAPRLGRDELVPHLVSAARAGVNEALAELAAQGIAAQTPDDEALAALVGDQADAVVTMAANGISLAAQRRASGLVGGRTPAQVRTELVAHLGGMRHQWTVDQLRGAVTMAQNVGRVAVFEAASPGDRAATYYASEILDANCCAECSALDGTVYGSLADAQTDYAAGGYVNCAGGPRCRGTIVAVYGEADPSSSSNPVGDVLDVGA